MDIGTSGAATEGVREREAFRPGTRPKVDKMERTESGGIKFPEGMVFVPAVDVTRPLTEKEMAASGMRNLSEALVREQQLQRYMEFASEAMREQSKHYEATFEKLNKGLGGLLNGAAVPNDIFGLEPVRTTSGAIHPQSDRIKEYLRQHAVEWKSLSREVPTFEQWLESYA